DRWVTREGEDELVRLLRALRVRWRGAGAHVPHLDRGGSGDPEAGILDLLGSEATSSRYRARLLFDASLFAYPELHRNAPPFTPLDQRRAALQGILRTLGVTRSARLLETVPAAAAFAIPLRRPAGDGVQEALPAQYLQWLRTASFESIRDEAELPG